MKTAIPILIALLFFSGCAARKYSIRPDDLSDWQMVERQVCSNQNDLKKAYGNNSQMLLGYQVKKAVIQTLRSADYKEIKVEIFITTDEANARNLYRRYQSITKVLIGTEGSQTPGFVSFYRGNNFVRITAMRNLTGKDQYLIDVARAIDKKLM
ncbi:MAG: DUF6599 family protein [Candidatus Neomarinimicrobiota bacterium]